MRLSAGAAKMTAVVVLLLLLHFALGPWLGDRRAGPDLLLLGLMVYAMRTSPGRAAVAGFALGLMGDSITVLGFGSGAIAHTCVAYLAAWGRAIFFTDNLFVSAGFFVGGTWFRDLLLLASGGYLWGGALVWQLVFWSLVKGVTTALVGVAVLFVFREWLNVRMSE